MPIDATDAAGRGIRLLEQSLAEVVHEMASRDLGPDWVLKLLPELKEELPRRMRPSGPLKFGIQPVSPVGYLHLGELKKVIVSKRYWHHFSEVFQTKERFSHLVDIVQEVRPAWAHPGATVIDLDTACYVLLTAKKVLNAVRPDRAEQVAALHAALIRSVVESIAATPEGVFDILAKPGALQVLSLLRERPLALTQSEVIRSVEDEGVPSAAELLSSFREAGWSSEYGGRLALTRRGRFVLYLARGLEGADLQKVIHDLMDESPSLRRYELVTEGMTHKFIEELYNDPTFGSLYIASPWISLDEESKALLQAAIDRAESHSGQEVVLIVVTRPPSGPAAWKEQLQACIGWLRALRADVQFVKRLHTKLLLREPSRRGGNTVAVFGSENLTRGQYLELGIKIRNDSSVTRQLVQHFFDLYAARN